MFSLKVNDLLNPKYYFTQQLNLLLQQCLGKLQLSEAEPTEYRSKLYLLQAMIFKLENQPVHALNAVHNALLAHPFDDVIDSLILFLNQPFFHSTVRLALIKDIKNDILKRIPVYTDNLDVISSYIVNEQRKAKIRKKEY